MKISAKYGLPLMPIYTIKELRNIKSLAEESFPFEIVVYYFICGSPHCLKPAVSCKCCWYIISMSRPDISLI